MGYFCSYTPIELISAAGYQPVRILGHNQTIATADSCIHPNYCQYIRSAIDKLNAGEFEDYEGIIFVNSCDAMRRMADVWLKLHPPKFSFMIDLPVGNSVNDRVYLKRQFSQLHQALEKFSDRLIPISKIIESITLFSQSRNHYQRLNNLRKHHPTWISASKLMAFQDDFYRTSPDLWNEFIARELQQIENNPVRASTSPKPRVILAGSPLHNREFLEFIQECGVDIVYEDNCSGAHFFEMTIKSSQDPLGDLADAYLNKPPCSRMMNMDVRLKHLLEKSKEFNADGLIYFSLKFCDTCLYDAPTIRQQFQTHQIPTLMLESDGTLGSLGQLKTRIEAFVEILKSNAKNLGGN